MKQQQLTKHQENILREIQELVTIGERKLQELAAESAEVDRKWQTLQQENNRDVVDRNMGF